MRRTTVRELATVTVTGTVRERRKPRRTGARNSPVRTQAVSREAMAAARAALRPGERLVIVSPTRIDIVAA